MRVQRAIFFQKRAAPPVVNRKIVSEIVKLLKAHMSSNLCKTVKISWEFKMYKL